MNMLAMIASNPIEFWSIWTSFGLGLILLAKLLVNTYTRFYWAWMFAWYDFWVGFYWDQKKRVLYFFPIPMFGMSLAFPPDPDMIKFPVRPLR